MKTLFLVRHAKSEWANENLADIDRPLNARGYKDAHFMSEQMKKNKLIPDLMIASPAIRATSTALIFARNLNYDCAAIRLKKMLYETTEKEYLKIISETENSKNSLMLFAHNPTLTMLSNRLTKPFTENIPTCGIVGIRFKINEWKEIMTATGELFLYDFPKKGG
ncbi:MAG: histidine phosphatase family protein [Bacteroidetes bacterium]|jgi:phosphohistidine phosphatase|nr:histidine phosphatase family protein [Bacteroidota bacterium]